MPAWLSSRPFRWLLTALAAGFVLWTALQLGRRWQATALTAEPLPALLACLTTAVTNLAVAVAWVWLAQRFAERHVPFVRSLGVYAESALTKYVPGRVANALMRLNGLAPYGFNARRVAVAMAIEAASWAATGALVASALWVGGWLAGWLGGGPSDLVLGGFALPIAASSALAVALLVLLPFERYPAVLRRALHAPGDGQLLPPPALLMHLASWLLWAGHGALLARAFGVSDAPGLLRAAVFLVLAPIAGFLALPLPAGVGVRESVTVLGLTPLVGPANALAAALLSRVASLAADVVAWLVLARRRRAEPAISEP